MTDWKYELKVGSIQDLKNIRAGELLDCEIDAANARRREMAAKDPGGTTDLPPLAYPPIQPNPLDELVPDLRGKIAIAEVSGAPIRPREGPAIEWPGAA
jgi:hypothetical protein